MDDGQLQTAWNNRQKIDRGRPLGQPLAMFMKHTLARRVKQVGKISQAWQEVVPEQISAHCCLESFHRGVLTVLVDTAAHRYQLQSLLRSGLQKALQERFAGPLNRIKLVPGQFYSLDDQNQQRYEF
ncbi:MAG: DUF721 domain-containing protein [Phycisphaerae bacterium]